MHLLHPLTFKHVQCTVHFDSDISGPDNYLYWPTLRVQDTKSDILVHEAMFYIQIVVALLFFHMYGTHMTQLCVLL